MHNVCAWLKRRISTAAQHDTFFWQVMRRGLWLAAGAAAIVGGLGAPTGFSLLIDLALILMIHATAFSLVTKVTSVLFSLMYLPVPRLFAGSLLYTGFSVYLILYNAQTGISFAVIISVAYTIASLIAGLALYLFANKKVSRKWKLGVGVIVLIVILIIQLTDSKTNIQPAAADYDYDDSITAGQEDNPGNPGSYAFRYFTYGNGKDKHRKEFASDVELVSQSVDASEYIQDEWPWQRHFFWGFDETELPLNGRVWMPEGKGPFPLVLMVHGNHTMEYFSDAGYGYLGELLASHGFIAISVDENFLNYSNWSGIPDEDMKVRAWLLIHHILQIEKFHTTRETPFYQKADLENIALIGHSRGGQAAAMAADYTRWFSADPSLSGFRQMNIKAVAGLAPTDTTIERKKARLKDTYYLVLQGAQDADVNSFTGDRQYLRSSYSSGSEKFKASLYIGEANHSQFNTQWGRMDSSLPKGLFLNQSDTMDAEAQREIAKVYISAFLDVALKGNDRYIQLFRDYRYGTNWLPDAYYVNRFESGMFVPLMVFNRSKAKDRFEYDVAVETSGLTYWEIEEAQDRRRRNKGVDGVVLAWNEPAAYTISVSDSFRSYRLSETPEHLLLSMANLERDLQTKKEHLKRPQVEIEITANASVRLPLDQFMPVPHQIYTQYMILPYFDSIIKKDKYKEAAEPVFQTYELPLQAFRQKNPGFNPRNITKITLHFSNGPGKIMLDNIGYSY